MYGERTAKGIAAGVNAFSGVKNKPRVGAISATSKARTLSRKKVIGVVAFKECGGKEWKL